MVRKEGWAASFAVFHLSLLEAVWTQCAGVVVSQMSFDVDDICPCSSHPHHIKTLSCQVVTWDKRSFLTLWPRASPAALYPADLQHNWQSQYKQIEVAPLISFFLHGYLNVTHKSTLRLRKYSVMSGFKWLLCIRKFHGIPVQAASIFQSCFIHLSVLTHFHRFTREQIYRRWTMSTVKADELLILSAL